MYLERAHPAFLTTLVVLVWLNFNPTTNSDLMTRNQQLYHDPRATKIKNNIFYDQKNFFTLLRIISGATYSGVPQKVQVLLPSSNFFENPKSTSFTYPSTPQRKNIFWRSKYYYKRKLYLVIDFQVWDLYRQCPSYVGTLRRIQRWPNKTWFLEWAYRVKEFKFFNFC